MRDVLAIIGAIWVVCCIGLALLFAWFWIRGWKAAPYIDEMQEEPPLHREDRRATRAELPPVYPDGEDS